MPEAQRKLNGVSVVGFSRVAGKSGTLGNDSWAEAFYIGPPASDVLRVIAVQGVVLTADRLPIGHDKPPDPLPGERFDIDVGLASGRWPNNCSISVSKVIENPYYEAELTKGQILGMRDGSAEALLVQVICGDG
ncbi:MULTISPECIES: hypothetical protein [unclassified Nocardia]|uniref:hypothetical protein n=1 Tax=unclassified Nocardia TaxID=2637762 RepID=UPI001CE3C949|nr:MULTISPECIES: hypothetical protein [unclassified Nocardia]